MYMAYFKTKLIVSSGRQSAYFFIYLEEVSTIKLNLTQQEYIQNNNVYEKLNCLHNSINNYNSDLNKHKGYILIAVKNRQGNFKVIRAYTLEEWETLQISSKEVVIPNRALNDPYRVLELNKDKDYYYTRNPYKTATSRLKDNLRGISSIVIDIDYNSQRGLHLHDKAQLKKRLKRNLIDKGLIPNYTTFRFSGTGVQLVYEFEQVSPKAEIIVKLATKIISETITKYLRSDKTLNMYRVDNVASNNTGGLARLGGYNTKSGLEVTRHHTGVKYTLDELLSLLGAGKADRLTQTNLSATERVEIKEKLSATTKFLLKHRLKQIEIYKKLKEDNGEVEGYRDTILFLYANIVTQLNRDEAVDLINQFNKSFIKPLKQNEVKKIVNLLETKTYTFKNETFELWLEIDDTNKHLFKTGQIRRRPGTIKKQQAREVKIKKLLSDPELNNSDIAKQLNVTSRTVQNWRKKHNIANPFHN